MPEMRHALIFPPPGRFRRLLFSVLAVAPVVFLTACSGLSKYAEWEKHAKETRMEIRSVSFANDYFAYVLEVDAKKILSMKSLDLKTEKVAGLLFLGRAKEVLSGVKMKIGIQFSNGYPLAFRVSEFRSSVSISGNNVKKLELDQPFTIGEKEKKNVNLILDAQSSLLLKAFRGKKLAISGTAAVSPVVNGQTLPAVNIDLEHELELDASDLAGKALKAGVNLESLF